MTDMLTLITVPLLASGVMLLVSALKDRMK